MLTTRAMVLRAMGGLLLLLAAACSDAGPGLDPPNSWRPWVEGGQTGALTPRCGLTPAAAAGDSIPGGTGGIVIHTDACLNFAVEELELHDEDGMMIAFDLEPLPGGAVLLRPRSPLRAGLYDLKIAGMHMEPVVAIEPAEVPSRLGRLELEGPNCGANFELTVDPLLLEYLPQLKLSVSVDGGPERVWFDYGTLEVEDGHAELSLPRCFPSCLANGTHDVRVTAELAGENGTLEPIDLVIQTECGGQGSAATIESDGACGAAPGGRRSAGGASFCAWLLAVALALWRSRRSSA